MKTLTADILAETKEAYPDCNAEIHTSTALMDKASRTRKLDWKASAPVSKSEAIVILTAAVPNYNNFKPELLEALPNDSEVLIARAGSPCIFVKTAKNLTHLKSALLADELDLQDDGFWRIWWD